MRFELSNPTAPLPLSRYPNPVMLLTMNGTLTVVFSSGQDEQDALEDRAEAEGVAEHHGHADDLQRSRHDLRHVPQEGATGEE